MAQSIAANESQPIPIAHRLDQSPEHTDVFNAGYDDLSDEASRLPSSDVDLEQGDENVIGVSISRAQTRMKSPTTPAAEKALALDQSIDYFNIHQRLTEESEVSTDTDATTQEGFQRGTEQGSHDTVPPAPQTPTSPGMSRIETQVSPMTNLDGNMESIAAPLGLSKTRTARTRTNSDNSLYLLRKPTGMSSFDDTEAYADVDEMANARFKAITDSFQNSTLRSKIPGMRNPAKSDTNASNNQDSVTKQNTEANAGSNLNHFDRQRESIDTMRKTRTGPIDVVTAKHKQHPVLAEAMSRLEGDLVVLGGYRGSILRSAKPPHRQCWAPVKVGLNLRSVDLEVGLTREDEERMEESIIPSGVLSHIGPIDICRRLLKHLNRCPNRQDEKLRIHDWGYDWRLSPDLLAQRMISFLESLQCNQPDIEKGKRGATVIAHSLGGLITRYAVNKRPDLFAGVLYAGVPQHCVNILGPLRNGDEVLLSSKVLTAQVNFTLRTSFALLPEDGRCFINKDTNERYDINFFDGSTWDEHCLSPCIRGALAPPAPKEPEHRKTIIGSISGTISSSLPSITSKRSSWFGGGTKEEPPPKSAEHDAEPSLSPRNKAKTTAHDVVDEARHIGRRFSPEGAAEHNIQPTMKSGSHHSNHTKSSIATTVTIPRDKAEEYLRRTLAEVLSFKKALAFNLAHQKQNRYPPHAFMYGTSVPTVLGAKVASREAIKYTTAYDDLAFARGDGVVLASAAQLPEGYRCVKGGRVVSDRGHVGLLGDLEGVGKCLIALIDARERGVGLGR